MIVYEIVNTMFLDLSDTLMPFYYLHIMRSGWIFNLIWSLLRHACQLSNLDSLNTNLHVIHIGYTLQGFIELKCYQHINIKFTQEYQKYIFQKHYQARQYKNSIKILIEPK